MFKKAEPRMYITSLVDLGKTSNCSLDGEENSDRFNHIQVIYFTNGTYFGEMGKFNAHLPLVILVPKIIIFLFVICV
jgi:hypothetical protein